MKKFQRSDVKTCFLKWLIWISGHNSVCAEVWLFKPETTPEDDNFGIVLWKAAASQHQL